MKKTFRPILCIACVVMIAALLVAGSFSFADKESEYLSDMTEKSVSTGWGSLCRDKGFDGRKINISDGKGNYTVYDKGVFVHAPSVVEYDISKKVYSTFEAYIGVNNSTDNSFPQSSSVTFEVVVDGKSLYKSGTFKIGTAAEHISIKIPAGAKTLTLKTTDATDGNTGDHSVWADAKLFLGENDPLAYVGLSLTADSYEAAKGSSLKLTATAKRFNGEQFNPQGAVFTSSDENIATVSSDGRVKLEGAGSAEITVTYTEGETTISDSVTLYSYDEQLINNWQVSSPDGSVTILISQGKFGQITYSVKKNGKTVVDEGSDVGIISQECRFCDGFSFVSKKTAIIDEHYTNYSGKTDSGYNHANELTLCFVRSDYSFNIIFRAYDDGFAFRYTISDKDGKSSENGLTFTQETSSFVVPSKSDIYAIKVGNLTSSFNHEAGYGRFTSDSANGYLAFPILYNTENTWVLLTEAELYGDPYVGSMTRASNRELTLQWAPKVISDSVETCVPFTSPWRMGIIGGLDTIVESNLTEDVCERREEDSSWVKPGVTAWMWLTEGAAGQHDYKTIKEYIDLASELGWKYLILDEGWQPRSNSEGKKYDGYYIWFDEMLEYAEQKDVGIIVWVLCADLDTPEERTILREWAEKGIKGIKVDFFDSEDAPHISYYKAIYEECYQNKLIVNVHGANKPPGERPYYPNSINREAVNGEEYGGFGVNDAVIWAFTRNVVGPVDITPRYNPSLGWSSTIGAQLAVNILFESGMQCMASKPDEYLTGSEYLLYKDLPSAWNETKFISGFPGQYSVIARRSGDSWYVGGMSVGARKVEITFDFLDDDCEYTALVFSDGTSRYSTSFEAIGVEKGDKITVDIRSNGGFAIRVIKKTALTNPSAIKSSKTDIVMKGMESVTLDYTLEPENLVFKDLCWESSDESVVIVTRGVVTALRTGKATVTARSYLDGNVKLEYNIEVKTGGMSLDSTWSVVNPFASEDYGLSVNQSGTLTIRTLGSNMSGNAKNIIAMRAPDGDFEVIVKINGLMKEYLTQGGIMLFNKDSYANVASVAYAYTDPEGDKYPSSTYAIAGLSTNGNFSYEPLSCKSFTGIWLKMTVKDGTAYFAFSVSGTSKWTDFDKTINVKNLFRTGTPMIGIYGCSAGGSSVVKLSVSDFRLNGNKIPFLLNNNEDDRTIVSSDIAEDFSITVEKGKDVSEINLPESINITLSDGSVENVEIEWYCENFNSGKAGEYSFVGTIKQAPESVSVGAFKVRANVIVSDSGTDETTQPTEIPESTQPSGEDNDSGSVVITLIIVSAVLVCVAAAVIIAVKKKSRKSE